MASSVKGAVDMLLMSSRSAVASYMTDRQTISSAMLDVVTLICVVA